MAAAAETMVDERVGSVKSQDAVITGFLSVGGSGHKVREMV